MKIKRILVPLFIMILMASTFAFGAPVSIGSYFDDSVMEYGNDGLTVKNEGIVHGLLSTDVITGLADVTSEDADYFMISDNSDGGALKKVDLGEVRATPNASSILVEELGTATYDDVQDWLNNTQSSGKISGGAISSHIDAITGVTVGGTGSGELKVADDQTAGYPASAVITVYGSTNNDGDYTVSAGGSSYSGGTTTIPVDEAVAAVADGNIRNGRVDITAGTGFIKTTDSEIGVTKSFDWTVSCNLVLTDLETNYIHINYNAGSPIFQATIDRNTIELNREFMFGMVYRNGTRTWVHSDGINLPNYIRNSHERLLDVWGYRRASGGEISEYGTRNIQSTTGIFYRGTEKVTTTTQASATDKMTTVYYDGSDWIWTPLETAIDNTQYNNIASGLATLSVNKYGVHWVCIDYFGELIIVYGQGNYTLTEAQSATIPSLMPVIATDFGIIAAKIIIFKNAASFTEIISAYTEYMLSASPATHNELSGLNGGTAGEYYHLTSTQHTQAIIKKKLDATQAPTVNNDVDEGYVIGSFWIDVTNDKGYICLDNTDGAAVWTEVTLAGSGYTNLTSFVDQNNWKIFYSNGSGDVIELALGVDGTYLGSNGATSAPTFKTPSGSGDMLKATYDVDEDNDVDVAAGGTEKSSWTQYCIPYLSGTTAFGEIPIGTDNYALTVNGAAGYDWTEFQTPLTFGVADTNKVQINSATVADDDYAKFTATGLEGRGYTEVLSDIGAEADLSNEAGLYAALSDVSDFIQGAEVNSIDSAMYVDASIDHEHLAPDVISGMTDVTSADADYILIWDATDSLLKKCDMAEVRGGGAGETNTASNIGHTADETEAKIFKQKDGVDFEFRSLKEGTAVDFTWVGDSGLKREQTSQNDSEYVTDAYYRGQYWTALSNYTIDNIQCLLKRTGTGSTPTLYVFAADANGYPTGDSLGSVAVDCSGITADAAGEFVTFDLSSSAISITETNKYCYYLIGTSGTTNAVTHLLKTTDVEATSWLITYESAAWGKWATRDRAFKIYAATSYYDYVQIGVVPGDIKLDDLGTPDDNTDNDASTTKHGLMPKLPFSGDLLSTTTVAFNADADTTLYTVPTGKRCVLSHAIVVAAGDAGATTTLSIGANGTETDFIPVNILSNLDAQYDSVILQPIPNTTPLKIKSYAAATVIEAQVASQSGVAGNTVYLFGIIY